jgi:hypothetical protein
MSSGLPTRPGDGEQVAAGRGEWRDGAISSSTGARRFDPFATFRL